MAVIVNAASSTEQLKKYTKSVAFELLLGGILLQEKRKENRDFRNKSV